MKKTMILKTVTALVSAAAVLFYSGISEAASEEASSEPVPSQIYAKYAALMDADTGRILYSKNGSEEAPMASTTKIMSCILVLENAELTDKVTVSENARSQPEVKLGMQTGDEFMLNDLLYSLMLESHNDTAVALAEHVSGSTEKFADLMNQKAKAIGCRSTYYITPNGLDAEDEHGFHHTTAEDLALVMRYCIMESPKKEDFIRITGTPSYSFSDCTGTKSYSCTNHNAFLQMMDGAISGKTGFTADAGYCYVGALENEGRTFIVSLLACGWPNNKGYKWADTRKLMNYAMDTYTFHTIRPAEKEYRIRISNGYSGGCPDPAGVTIPLRISGEPVQILMKSDEPVEQKIELNDNAAAPVRKGDVLGTVTCLVDQKAAAVFKLTAEENVRVRDFHICLAYVEKLFLL